MRNPWTATLLLGACVALAYGCGDDDDNASGNAGRGGSAGHAGTGGKGGSGGSTGGSTSGKGGSGGSTGGKGGASAGTGSSSAGKGGSGATGNSPGGASGAAGHDAGGEAGHCEAEVPTHKLASCEGAGASIETSCSVEATCKALDCGGTWSAFEANGCPRPQCDSSDQCGPDERCVAAALVNDDECRMAADSYDGCSVDENCGCSCEYEEVCEFVAYCQPVSEFPADADCPLDTIECPEIGEFISNLQGPGTPGAAGQGSTAIEADVAACLTQAQAKAASCSHAHGAGGEGGEAGKGGEGGTPSH